MVNIILQRYAGISRFDCLFVGDRSEDEKCAAGAGIKFLDAKEVYCDNGTVNDSRATAEVWDY